MVGTKGMKKGLKRIDEQIDANTHEIRQYGRKLVRRVHYKLQPNSKEDLDFIKEIFPDFLDTKPFKKLIPNASIEGDEIVYRCPKRPTVHYHVKTGTIRVPKKDWNKFKKPRLDNQAHFVVHQIKECADYFEIKYVEIKYLPRRLRHGRRANWNLWQTT